MTSGSLPKDKHSARIETVEQHIRLENEHDLEGVLRTFSDSPRYEMKPGANIIRAGAESACFTSS